MSKSTTKQQSIKQPKTVPISVILPWILLAMFFMGFAGLVTGWNWRSTAYNEIKSDVALSSKEQAR